MARVTTRTGDEGYTSLLGAGRVPKYHPRTEALGTLDEATSALGLARAHSSDETLDDRIIEIQRELYLLMAELATLPENRGTTDFKIREEHVARLDALGDALKLEVEIGKQFIIPGATVVSASLDVSRTIVRRAERQVVRMYHEGEISRPEVVRYLNRLSDVLFILARHEESHSRARSTPD